MEYLFRGISKSDKKWIYGDVVHVDGDTYIFNDSTYEEGRNSPDRYEVIPETVGMFTGWTDVEKTNIFHGDKFDAGENDGSYYMIEWDDKLCKFSVNLYSYAMTFNEGSGEEFDNEISCIDRNVIDVIDLYEDKIIGSVHDHLLKK